MKFFILNILIFVCVVSLASSKEPNLENQLKELVEINSGSANPEGVRKIQILVENKLKELGFKTQLDKNNFLSATLTGTSKQTITFIVHADTVFEPSSGFIGFNLTSDKTIAKGPGVIDDKGGIIVAIEGIRRYLQSGAPKVTLRFISSPNEEIGSPTTIDQLRKFAKDTWLVLGFEPALEDGSIIDSRRGDRWYDIQVKGKESHAGRSHKEGINACIEMASKLLDISKLTNYDKNVTVSVGHIEGGQNKYNIVCGESNAKIDTRFSNLTDRDDLHSKILKILNKNYIPGSSTSFELKDDTPPFSKNKLIEPFIIKYLAALKKTEGHESSSTQSGGSAESNYFSSDNSLIIDGLGPIGGKMHTKDEFILLSSLTSRAEALNQFLISLD
jgi:glutamate carboxypeptidase